ncbi:MULTISPECIES: cutinase family protein [Mycobacteriaceae]|uniref:cutinase family protein n=1 Tax=Mycobacteriaceae TaxID=1762 RepID=UPI0007FCB8B7|nr:MULTISPECIES: cutinase family protein [Mycobacteriaceae]MCK0177435.1 cutinase family protein [Mycolicibacterium sp. F2034L]OBB61512.1 cutinase [Mycobacterium sp. 852013-51886_SCH5428379]
MSAPTPLNFRRPTVLAGAAAAAVSLSAAIGALTTGVAVADPAPPCPEVEVVFARGTFEAPGIGATGQAFIDALNARVGTPVAVYGVNYPATLDFPAAVDGVVDASQKIESIVATCPDTKIVLGGYSQGAAVAAYTTFDEIPPGLTLPPGIGPMPPATAEHVDAVALFGTPDNWFLNLVDSAAPPITVGHLYSDKTIQLCATGDPVCFPGGFDRAAHSSYKSNGMADQAAAFVADRLASAPSSN